MPCCAVVSVSVCVCRSATGWLLACSVYVDVSVGAVVGAVALRCPLPPCVRSLFCFLFLPRRIRSLLKLLSSSNVSERAKHVVWSDKENQNSQDLSLASLDDEVCYRPADVDDSDVWR